MGGGFEGGDGCRRGRADEPPLPQEGGRHHDAGLNRLGPIIENLLELIEGELVLCRVRIGEPQKVIGGQIVPVLQGLLQIDDGLSVLVLTVVGDPSQLPSLRRVGKLSHNRIGRADRLVEINFLEVSQTFGEKGVRVGGSGCEN